MATKLFGCYPRSQASDPDIFIAGATTLLACYPKAIVRRVCDPANGLPSTDERLPSIARIRAACEAAIGPRRDEERREREREHTRAVTGVAKAATGSLEHRRVVAGFNAARRATLGEPHRPAPAAAPVWQPDEELSAVEATKNVTLSAEAREKLGFKFERQEKTRALPSRKDTESTDAKKSGT
jgi:hypothetical protein